MFCAGEVDATHRYSAKSLDRNDAMSVKTDLSAQPDPERYLHVMDVHSHNTMVARFSRTDDRDEQATRLYMVIGRLDRYYPEICCRFACGGWHVEIPAEQVSRKKLSVVCG